MANLSITDRFKAPITRFWWHVRGIGLTLASCAGTLVGLKTQYEMPIFENIYVEHTLNGCIIIGVVLTVFAQSTHDPEKVNTPTPPEQNNTPNV